ncbi:MAG: archease [Candidatus Nanohaloarchaea archaeon]|nr:archease [Candidatus Nanohaloarchaea archaeon]
MSDFTILGHTADVMFQAEGATLDQAFANAGRATFACMADLDDIPAEQSVDFRVSASDLGSLLYDFIDQLIYLRDVNNMLYSEFDVEIDETDDGYQLQATAHGRDIGDIDAVDVKAVTYSDMEIEQRDDGWHIQVVLDV